MIWPLTNIIINGKKETGIAPLIVSASRSTDIPAFYAKKFIDCLKRGYLFWTNPFSGKKILICLSEVQFIVFWTKNAAPIIPFLNQIDDMGIAYYFTYTLNDYEKEGLENNLPPLTSRIDTFKQLAEKIGKEKVIWRFDPLVLLKNQKDEVLVSKITNIASQIYNYTDKLVISFVDTTYRRVQERLEKSGVEIERFEKEDKIRLAKKIVHNLNPFLLKIATCAESEDLQLFGLESNKCLDDELIVRVAKGNTILTKFIEGLKSKNQLKDKGQRKHCGCIVSKDIGAYNSCRFSCLYCYAGYQANMSEVIRIFE